MALAFTKMQGLGNDFVVLDATRTAIDLSPAQARRIADRRFGVGCDQLLIVEPAQRAGADFGYRIVNADGNESGQCGNGARCFARFVREAGLTDKTELVVDAAGGRLRIEALGNHCYRVALGVPSFEPSTVPLADFDAAPSYTLDDIAGRPIRFAAVSLGNPHAVIDVPGVAAADVAGVGAAMTTHRVFPEGVNTSFVETIDRALVRLRVFERGVGETLACGSAAAASVAAGVQRDALDGDVRVELPGGTARVEWAGAGTPIYLSGPAVRVFDGTLTDRPATTADAA